MSIIGEDMSDFEPFIPKEQKLLKSGAYCDRLFQLLPEIKTSIEESPTQMISISLNDMREKLGPKYKPHSLQTVYISTKYGLIEEGINVQMHEKENILMSYRSKEDKMPRGYYLAKKQGFVCKSGKQVK